MSLLLTKQQDFFDAFCRWGVAVKLLGYQCSFGDAYRDPRATFPYSFTASFHSERKAVDVNLFKDGKYLQTPDEWREAGELWESLGGTWGGRWANGDANHLSWGEV